MEYYKKNHPNIEIMLINEEAFKIVKSQAYKDYISEKELRGFFRSNVNKNLTKNNLVILDSLNYIKGYRYELFCICRTIKTKHCVVFLDTNISDTKKFNEKSKIYSEELLKDLSSRMERPIEKNRWDKPLFTVWAEDPLPID